MLCTLCNHPVTSVTHVAEQWLIGRIRARNPDWVSSDGGCEKCIEYYRTLDDSVELLDDDA